MNLLAFRGFLEFYLDEHGYHLVSFGKQRIIINLKLRPKWVWVVFALLVLLGLLAVVLSFPFMDQGGLPIMIAGGAAIVVGIVLPMIKRSRLLIVDLRDGAISLDSTKLYFPEIANLVVWHTRSTTEASADSHSNYEYDFHLTVVPKEGSKEYNILTFKADYAAIDIVMEQMAKHFAAFTGLPLDSVEMAQRDSY